MKFPVSRLNGLLLGFALLFVGISESKADTVKDTLGFEIGKGSFYLNGHPFIIKAAELHYPRIPREYWENRIQMAKALGMNTICLYTFWNIHEQEKDRFDFEGQNDLREFILLCEKNGMKVILRPGPYVCAEWEMGGLPWWLLQDKDVRLRENDPVFIDRVEAFQREVANRTSDLTADKGGPILMIQVENEYGSYGEDKEYVGAIRDILRKYYGENVPMFQCDWSSNFTLNGLDDLLWTMNFGTGADIDSQFAELRKLRPESPLMCSEFWSGWFDKWGAQHETRSADAMIEGIDEMLSKNISFSLYMTHGGTNWGHWAGANSPGYSPDVTSYDYDAPISENGQPTDKFWLLRQTMAKYVNEGDTLPDLPPLIETTEISSFKMDAVAPLFKNLPSPLYDDDVHSIEHYGMGFGSVLYSTTLPETEDGSVLTVNEPHDYALVYIDGNLVETLDRRLGETEVILNEVKPGARLDILVEAMGRINFGRAIKDFKGITENVTISAPDKSNSVILKGWDVYLLPDDQDFYVNMNFESLDSLDIESGYKYPQGVYKGSFFVERPFDTFLDLSTWGKGLVYVNGHPLGRFWSIGPQQTLYLPGAWLREGENEILIFDIEGPVSPVTSGRERPILNEVKGVAANASTENPIDIIIPEQLEKITETWLPSANGWKTIKFEEAVDTDMIILNIKESWSETGTAAIAEIHVIDENGMRLDREGWEILSESEDVSSGNNTAGKMIDLQESTYWKSDEKSSMPQRIVIKLADKCKVSGISILPRMETGAPDSVKLLEIYVR